MELLCTLTKVVGEDVEGEEEMRYLLFCLHFSILADLTFFFIMTRKFDFDSV